MSDETAGGPPADAPAPEQQRPRGNRGPRRGGAWGWLKPTLMAVRLKADTTYLRFAVA